MRPRATIALLAVFALFGFLALALFIWMRTARASASPEQPLLFPHAPHTKNQIDCTFCHAYVEQHAVAGMPRVTLCVNCHGSMPQESEDAKKLFEYEAKGEEIPWVRLYALPQYNTFNHKRHAKAGVACAECHGAIGESVRAERHMDLKMAWCIDCHRTRNASTDCLTCHR